MSTSINPYNTRVSTKASAQENSRTGNTPSTTSGNLSSGTATTVSISSSAQALYIQSSAVERQASMSQSQLNSLRTNTDNLIYNFGQSISTGNYNKEALLPQTDDPARLALGQKSVEYAISAHKSPPGNTPNPFAGMERNDLSAITYDDSGTYTTAERYAAWAELREQDEAYFSKLFAKITNGGDNREVFKGILDYFDNLPPVEKTAYPSGYRDNIESLYQEQLTQWGPLALIKQSVEEESEKLSESTFKEGQSSQEMLQATLEKVIELSKAD